MKGQDRVHPYDTDADPSSVRAHLGAVLGIKLTHLQNDSVPTAGHHGCSMQEPKERPAEDLRPPKAKRNKPLLGVAMRQLSLPGQCRLDGTALFSCVDLRGGPAGWAGPGLLRVRCRHR